MPTSVVRETNPIASKIPQSDPPGPPSGEAVRVALERFATERLAELLPRQRWFASKGRPIASVAVRDAASLGGRAPGAVLILLDVVFEQGPGETYVVPLFGLADGRDDATVLGQAEADGVPLRVAEPFDDSGFCGALLRAFAEGLRLPARHGTVRFVRAGAFPAGPATAGLVARRLKGEQSNTSVVYGDTLILKTFRRPEAGVNPEHEMTGFLTTRARFAHVPQLAGAVEYNPAEGPPITLGVLHLFTRNQGDGWGWALEHLARLREFVATHGQQEPLTGERFVQLVRDFSAGVLGALGQLGELTGGLHVALASDPGDPAFAPELIADADVAGWRTRMAGDLERTLRILHDRRGHLTAAGRQRAEALLAEPLGLAACLEGLEVLSREGCHKIRIHGDYHLGQTLRTDGDFVILDFKGEPARPLAERRAKHCALRDVAGMVRSLDYAAATAFGEGGAVQEAGETWRRLAVDVFLDAYLEATRAAAARLVPASRPALGAALAAFALDKALYEVRYEIDNRPTWVEVPLRGLERLRAGRAWS
jgi:maltose alpha-D-glucosyltransferase/alpha-amylase